MGNPYVALAMAAVSAYQASKQKPVQPQNVLPPPPPQAAKMPGVAGLYGAMGGVGQAGGQKGPGQTFLTGASGVDPNALSLNKPTLLGE